MTLEPEPGFERDFDVARRAVERGWLAPADVETAMLAVDQTPGSRLLSLLPLTPEQIRELKGEVRPPPPEEVRKAAEDPARRVGRYVLVESLGRGGMGHVHRAWDTELSRWVALKILRRTGDAAAEAHFEREARLAAALSHPNIAAIYETGEAGGDRFIAMQLVSGWTLDRWPRTDVAGVLRLVRDAARAVDYAHRQGLVHRDLKPENLMVESSEEGSRVMVLDFGLARPVEGGGKLSLPGDVIGTPSYMSPEQARGEKVDRRADVFSLGATLYEALTGRRAFGGGNVLEILRKIETVDPVPPRRINPAISADLETIVLKSLEKDRERRYANARELADDLDRFLERDPIHARPPDVLYRLRMALARRKGVVATAAAAALVLSALLGWWAFVGSPESRHARLMADATISWSEARGAAMVGRDPEGIARRAREARKAFEKALEVREDAQGHVMRARCLQLEGNDREAMADLERAHALDRDHPEACVELAKALIVEHRRFQSDREVSLTHQGGSPRFQLSGPGSETDGERRLRERALGIMKDRKVSPSQESLIGGLLALGQGDHARAAEALARYGKIEPWDASVPVLEGRCRHHAGDLVGAIAAYDRSLDRVASSWGFRSRAMAKYALGRLDEAIADYTRAIELEPRSAVAWTGRAISQIAKGRYEEAIADYTKAIEVEPDYAVAWTNRGNAKWALGRMDEAIADHGEAIKRDLKLALAWSNRGTVKRDKGLLDEAIEDLSQAIKLEPRWAPAWANRGSVWIEKGRYDESIADEDRAIGVDPKLAAAWSYRGTARVAQGRFDDAIADFSQAIDLDPLEARYRNNRGVAKSQKGLHEEAIVDFDEAIKRDPKLADAYSGRGSAQEALGLFDDARASYENALGVAPPGWPDRALVLDLIENCKAGPLFREAERRFDEKRYAEAIEALKKLVEAHPRAPVAVPSAYNIACGYALLGKKGEALDWLEKAVAMGWKDVAHIEEDADLESLRGETRFKKLVERLKSR